MKAEIISIGTEILLGEITDTNASFLAYELPALGIDLYWITQVGDNLGRLTEAFKRAWDRSDIIITTGGLGPTEDDLTREAIAGMLGEEITIDPELEKEIRDFFSGRGFEMPPSNIKQAAIIPSATPITNPRGTAPGWWVEREGKTIIAMPGPPSEMQRMWQKEVSQRLAERVGEGVIVSKTIKTFGYAESSVGEMMSHLVSSTNPTLGVYAKLDGIYLRITAKAKSEEKAHEMIARMEESVRSIVGESIWGVDNDTLEELVGGLLTEKGITLATMESLSGGLLSSIITDVPGSSNYFKGGIVSYTNEFKIASGIDPELISAYGVVSPQVAEAMAEAARVRLGADIGIGITGVAGPEPLEGKQPGIAYISIDDGKSKKTVLGLYPQRRPEVKRRAALHALFELRKTLLSRG